MKVKKCILRKSDAPKIEWCGWDFSTSRKDYWIVVVSISTGSRKLEKYYSYVKLQEMLTAYMDSIDAVEDDPDRDLQHVVIAEHYSVLESVLDKELSITGIPRLEEASKAMRELFNTLDNEMFIEGKTLFSLLEGEEAESFAKDCGFTTWDKLEDSLKKDIERFNLQNMVLFHYQDIGPVYAIVASAGILTKFTTNIKPAKRFPYDFKRKNFTTKIVSSTFSTCTALFPEMDMVYIYVVSGVRNKCLAYTFSELQEELTKAMGDSEDNPDRDLLYVLENKRFFVLEKILEPDINKWTPNLGIVSDSLKEMFYRLLDSPAPKYEVTESEADLFAKSVGCTWDDVEEALKRDINEFGLSEAFRFHESDYAVSVNYKLLKHISA